MKKMIYCLVVGLFLMSCSGGSSDSSAGAMPEDPVFSTSEAEQFITITIASDYMMYAVDLDSPIMEPYVNALLADEDDRLSVDAVGHDCANGVATYNLALLDITGEELATGYIDDDNGFAGATDSMNYVAEVAFYNSNLEQCSEIGINLYYTNDYWSSSGVHHADETLLVSTEQ